MAVHSPHDHDDFRGISLCAGVGGLDLGLHIAQPGYRTVCFVERNSFCAATLVARMADATMDPAPVWDDLKSFDGRRWRGRVHIVTAGYPCQPFALAGHRRGQDDPRHLWPDVARTIDEIRPEWVFLENVPGHLSLGFQDVAGDLQGLGYRVAARVVSAAEVGGSHLRDRLFILAHANIQKLGQPDVHQSGAGRDQVRAGSEPERIPDRAAQCGGGVEADVGPADCVGLDAGSFPVFAPLPGDFAEWGKALTTSAGLKPCIHGLDDGVADRLDRSSSAGNGVVALAAAHAFCTLRAELEDRI